MGLIHLGRTIGLAGLLLLLVGVWIQFSSSSYIIGPLVQLLGLCLGLYGGFKSHIAAQD
jgi:hypothetical protein